MEDMGMRVGVLTGGGDCPGLNAVIRAVVRKGVQVFGYEFIGFRDGWRGPLEGDTVALDVQAVRGILPRGGTILGSSRTNPIKIEGGVERIKDNLAGLGVDALIAIGGGGTPPAARPAPERGGDAVGGAPTKANNPQATPHTIGFDTPLHNTTAVARSRSQTPSTRPTTRSVSTPRSTSRWRRSTGCTRPPSRTTAR